MIQYFRWTGVEKKTLNIISKFPFFFIKNPNSSHYVNFLIKNGPSKIALSLGLNYNCTLIKINGSYIV